MEKPYKTAKRPRQISTLAVAAVTNSPPPHKATARSNSDHIVLVYFWTTQYARKYVAREFWVEMVRGSNVDEFKSSELYVLYGTLNLIYCTNAVP